MSSGCWFPGSMTASSANPWLIAKTRANIIIRPLLGISEGVAARAELPPLVLKSGLEADPSFHFKIPN